MKNLTINEIIKACGGIFTGDEKLLDSSVCGIETDSRELKPGYLFIPIRGEKFDGHDFIEKAFEMGALITLSEKDIGDYPHIKVASTFKALKDIAEYYRGLFDVKVVAVTGSVGKTTTKEMLHSVLSQKYNVLKSQKNYNNEIGVPLTLFNLSDEHEIAVIEMGMNHFGEIQRLSKTARPDICVITNIGHSHVGHLESREGIFKAKSEIFKYIKKGGIAVLNGDDDLLCTVKSDDFDTFFYGYNKGNDVQVTACEPHSFSGSSCELTYNDEVFEFEIKMPGAHMAYAAAAAYCIGKKLGLEGAMLRKGIAEFVPVGNRMEIIDTPNITILNDVYNASPESVKAAIEVLLMAKGRKVCVLGDMFELGDMSDKLHSEIGMYAAECGMDILLCAGDASKNTAESARENGLDAYWFKTKEEMSKDFSHYIKKGDIILVKASRGMHFEQAVEALKNI
jgi:UDP-N-acetylmuramoyl-tripeptide--D-alanyl-D-alanine ligase